MTQRAFTLLCYDGVTREFLEVKMVGLSSRGCVKEIKVGEPGVEMSFMIKYRVGNNINHIITDMKKVHWLDTTRLARSGKTVHKKLGLAKMWFNQDGINADLVRVIKQC